jgi:HK97 family phage major capsid protein
LQDNAYNLEGYLTGAFAYSNGLAEETAFISGNGVKKPRGFILDAQVGVTAELHDEIAYEEILDLYASPEAAYDFGARWLVNKGTLVEIMKMKDGAGQYIYHASTLPGELGHILGALVTISSLMPPIAALAKPLAYGNFKNYLIQDRLGFLLQRLDEVYAGNGFIGFRGRSRVDGRLLIPESIKVLAMAAAPSSSS